MTRPMRSQDAKTFQKISVGKFACAVLILLCAFVSTRNALAYPSFIGYGYTSCIVCHFNAFGNGPLTDYGRALGATAIADKPPYNRSISDQDLGEQSGFLGPVKFPDWLRLSGDYRGMALFNNVGADTSSHRFINMQIEGNAVAKLKDDRLIAAITFGTAPPPGGNPATTPDQASKPEYQKFISREHYVSYVVRNNFRLYAGFMDVVYGIRTPDHNAYSRTLNKVAQNDQTHGIAAHLGFSKAEVGVHAFVGNLYQNSAVRPTGMSVMFEYDVAEKLRLGASALASFSTVRDRELSAIHLRAGIGKGSSALIEMGLVRDAPKGSQSKLGSYIYTQTMTRLLRGLHFLFTGEYKTVDTFRPNPRFFRVGPSVQYFPMQRIELRLDLLGTRSLGVEQEYNPTDSFTVMGQLHLWF